MADCTGVDIDNGLKIELKPISRQSMANSILPMNLFLHARHVDTVLEHKIGIASPVFGFIQGGIRLSQQIAGMVAMIRK